MKKLIAIVLTLVLALSFAACAQPEAAPAETAAPETTESAAPAELVKVKVGASVTPHAEILNAVKDELKAAGYDLEVVEFTDYVLPNTALEDGDLIANYFQHTPYLNSFNAEHGTHLVSVVSIHYEPFGIYAGKAASIDALTDGAKIAVPNDGSNETRALLLLQQEGILTLKEGIDASSNATKLDIAGNPKNIEIVEMEAAQLVNSLPDVDLAVINGNYALLGGLNAATDALAIEDASGDAAQTYANIIAVKEGSEKDPGVLALVKALQSDAVRDYINATYGGAVVPIF